MTRALRVMCLICSLLLVPGCSFYQSPRFELVSAREIERTETATVIAFEVEATNPNEAALPLARASYRLSLAGQEVFSGKRSALATAPAYGTQRLELPAVVQADDFDLSALESGELRFELTGTVEYQTPGQLAEVFFDTGVRRPKARLGLRGTLDLGPAPGDAGGAGSP